MANKQADSSIDQSPSSKYVESRDEFQELLAEERKVLVDFYADWCGPCQMMAPMIDDLAAESEAPVMKVDVEALPQVANQYDVSSIPTFIAFEDGDERERFIGVQDKGRLAQTLE